MPLLIGESGALLRGDGGELQDASCADACCGEHIAPPIEALFRVTWNIANMPHADPCVSPQPPGRIVRSFDFDGVLPLGFRARHQRSGSWENSQRRLRHLSYNAGSEGLVCRTCESSGVTDEGTYAGDVTYEQRGLAWTATAGNNAGTVVSGPPDLVGEPFPANTGLARRNFILDAFGIPRPGTGRVIFTRQLASSPNVYAILVAEIDKYTPSRFARTYDDRWPVLSDSGVCLGYDATNFSDENTFLRSMNPPEWRYPPAVVEVGSLPPPPAGVLFGGLSMGGINLPGHDQEGLPLDLELNIPGLDCTYPQENSFTWSAAALEASASASATGDWQDVGDAIDDASNPCDGKAPETDYDSTASVTETVTLELLDLYAGAR